MTLPTRRALEIPSQRRARLPRPGFRVPGFLFSLLVLPVVALFCWNWNARSGEIPGVRTAREDSPLRPPETPDSESFLVRSLRIVSQPLFVPAAARPNPFEGSLGRDMVGVQSDPFLLAYSSGQTSGELIVRELSRGIVTLGFPSVRTGREREILRSIDQGLGGSFSQFFTRVLSHSAEESTFGLERAEENPFRVAMKDLDPTAKSTAATSETRSATAAAKEQNGPAE